MTKLAQTKVNIVDTLAKRWSSRAYDAERALKPQQISALIEAARWAPSCFNDQPWRFIVFNKFTNEPAWNKALSVINEKNQSWAKNAPVFILAVASHNFAHNGKPNRWSQYDTGAATVSICLQATELGLMSRQMGGFNTEKARDAFNIPSDYTPMAVVAVGYPAEPEVLPDEFVDAESAERVRKDIHSLFFDGHWDNGIE